MKTMTTIQTALFETLSAFECACIDYIDEYDRLCPWLHKPIADYRKCRAALRKFITEYNVQVSTLVGGDWYLKDENGKPFAWVTFTSAPLPWCRGERNFG